jgi:hypothetical protein
MLRNYFRFRGTAHNETRRELGPRENNVVLQDKKTNPALAVEGFSPHDRCPPIASSDSWLISRPAWRGGKRDADFRNRGDRVSLGNFSASASEYEDHFPFERT